MKTVKQLIFICLIILAYNCSSDDDNNEGEMNQATVQELLVSGKWYNETKTPGADYTDCEKNGYVEFKENGEVIIESFDDASGPCESLGANTATYTLTNDRDIIITAGSDVFSVVIDSISQASLTITSVNGETIIFDKTQG